MRSFVSTISISGAGYMGWYIDWMPTNVSAVRDMSNYYDGSVRFWFKSTSGLTGKLKFGIRSVNVVAGIETSAVILNNSFATDGAANVFDGNWHPMRIPLAALAGATPLADLARMKILFSAYAVSNDGSGANGTFYIDNLRWDSRLPGTVASIQVTPTPVTLPWGIRRMFSAQAFDAAGVPVDVLPTWSSTVGSVTPGPKPTTIFTGPSSDASGIVRASVGAISGSASVSVQKLIVNQSYNVYSDLGAGGNVGVSFDGAPGTGLGLSEPHTGSVEGTAFFHSTFTLQLDGGHARAFANWYVEETNTSRFMNDYADGYLQFYVRTATDLEFAIRSSNVTPGEETSKFTLGELGVPLDNNWQLVVVPISALAARDPNLDLARIQTYFVITAKTELSGAN
jgi:hypothetical protein